MITSCVGKIHIRLSLSPEALGYFPTFLASRAAATTATTLTNSPDGGGDDMGPSASIDDVHIEGDRVGLRVD